MTTRTSTRRPRPGTTTSPARSNLLLLGILAAVIVAGLITLAYVLVSDGDDEHTAADFDTSEVTVEGTPLPRLPDGGADPAVDQPAPVLTGETRSGSTLTTPAAGRATVLLFLAHWCPHCRAEVPLVRDWVDEGKLPSSVDLVGVATATTPDRPNYPPSAWFDDEKWNVPTISDAGGDAARAYGLSAFPFWVAVNDQGLVVERRSGELTEAQISDLATLARTR